MNKITYYIEIQVEHCYNNKLTHSTLMTFYKNVYVK